MSQITESLDFLAWPIEVVNVVRDQLAGINVQLPAVLVQSLALGVFVGLAIMFVKLARVPQSSMPRLISSIVACAAGVAGIAIVAAWADNMFVKRNEHIIGIIDTNGAPRFNIDLIDYRGEPMVAQLNKDSTGAFVITYSSGFADPPSAIVASASSGCEKRISLRRAHLVGNQLLTITLECDDSKG